MRDEIEELKRLCIRHVAEAREAGAAAERARIVVMLRKRAADANASGGCGDVCANAIEAGARK